MSSDFCSYTSLGKLKKAIGKASEFSKGYDYKGKGSGE